MTTEFGKRLKELREEKGMTQPELASKTGLTKDGIAQLEQGRRLPAWETVQALCDALGVSCESFRTSKKDKAGPGKRGRPKT